MAKTSHSKADLEHALAIVRGNHGNIARSARELSVSRSTLSSWVNRTRRGRLAEDTDTGPANASDLRAAENFARVRDLYSEHLAKPEVVERATAQQAATVVGIMEDKRRGIFGKPQGSDFSVAIAFVTSDGRHVGSLTEVSDASLNDLKKERSPTNP